MSTATVTRPFMTRETVARDTPAASATWVMVMLSFGLRPMDVPSAARVTVSVSGVVSVSRDGGIG